MYKSMLVVTAALVATASAHGGHEMLPPGEAFSPNPLDAILWMHIVMETFAFGIIFPIGMVLGIIRNRWHVPVQITGSVIALVGYALGHLHRGRQFAANVHASFANVLMLLLLAQIVSGAYLRRHLEHGVHAKIRPWAVRMHGAGGKIMPVLAWMQMLFGVITALGFCRGEHLTQCVAHFVMGSAFVAYGVILMIIMLVGQVWLQRTGRTQAFFDSAMIAAWGCLNTLTQHRWGQPWDHTDIQHTTIGFLWWTAGVTGLWLSRRSSSSPDASNHRKPGNFIPGLVYGLTGWAMCSHAQHLAISTVVHSVFGYTLIATGLTQIVEVIMERRDTTSDSSFETELHGLRYISIFLHYAAGLLFLGATHEQMQLLVATGISATSYVLVLYSFAFLMFLFTNVLVQLYAGAAEQTTLLSAAKLCIHDHEALLPCRDKYGQTEVHLAEVASLLSGTTES